MTITRTNSEGVIFMSNLGIQQAIANPTPDVITLTYSTTSKTLASPTYAANTQTCAAGDTGATGGAFATSTNRDKVVTDIAGLNTALIALAADVVAIEKVIAQLVTSLANQGIVQVA